MKEPRVIIGNPFIECIKCKAQMPKPIGVYLHAILMVYQTHHYVYLYYFDDKSTIVNNLYALLQFIGVQEIYKRSFIEVPSKSNPTIMIKRFEVRWDKIAALKSLRWK